MNNSGKKREKKTASNEKDYNMINKKTLTKYTWVNQEKKVEKIKEKFMLDIVHTDDNSQSNRPLSFSVFELCISMRFWQLIEDKDMVRRLHLLG